MTLPTSLLRRALAAAASGLLMACAAIAQPSVPVPAGGTLPQPAKRITREIFKDVPLYRPAGAVQQFVVLLTGGDAPSPRDLRLVQAMTAQGAMVIAVPGLGFYRSLAAVSQQCVHGPGALENFARFVQAGEKLPTYIEPILVGTGQAGALAYGLLAQSPADTYTGALSLDFCPRLALPLPMCGDENFRSRPVAGESTQPGRPAQTLRPLEPAFDLQPAKRLAGAWTAMGADPRAAACAAGPQAPAAFTAQVPNARWVAPAEAQLADAPPPGFDAAFAQMAAQRAGLALPPSQLADLPVTEVPVQGPGKRFAVLVSGDGGWASIDKRLAAALAKDGIPVAGLDSLRYFWTRRTPEGVAADLDRLIRYYAARWGRSEVLLLGYSQGADVLPFVYNRLPERTRASVKLLGLLGPGEKAAFEFHVSNWIGKSGDQPIAPEAKRLPAGLTLCVYGTEEKADSLCPRLDATQAKVLPMPGGHHLGENYEDLAAKVLQAAPPLR
ncbi:AcvB/VirJ family lysyl-phosphatidylglycerol hydrolase [uncultured Pseudacidovorax sp.]|uniref:virulence factor family protein n=1 Tax=uncultured Pseudacidovorax sp. TaxID=679313 RepID=UPI0025E28B78|nr:AcvB/VirJ family lysyl-phosphatidylglycerol hydrolase [uncultured Pseudacidovorax sp.]